MEKKNAALDLPLDQIIDQKRKSSRGSSRGGFRGSNRGRNQNTARPQRQRNFTQGARNRGSKPYTTFKRKSLPAPTDSEDGMWAHDMYEENQEEDVEEPQVEEQPEVDSSNPGKVLLKNLSWEITEDKLKEICEEIGAVKKIFIKYDFSGRSEGRGHVIFESAKDAMSAVKHLDGMDIKGEKLGATFVELKEKQPKATAPAPQRRGRGSLVISADLRSDERRPLRGGSRGNRGGRRKGEEDNQRVPRDTQPKFSFGTLDDDLEKYQRGRK